MGRKSYDVIGKPLEDSVNIIITRNKTYQAPGAVVVHSLDDAINVAGDADKIYVIGGGEIFNRAILVADRMETSVIQSSFTGANAYFPSFSKDDWTLISDDHHPKDSRHAFAFDFQIWKRKS